jgi:hypothetical protein
MIFLVTYELKGQAGSYKDLFEVLKSYDSWWHYLRSTWLVDAELDSPQQLYDAIQPYLQENDHVLVTRFVDGYAGWLPRKGWQWMKNRGLKPR